jgi:PAS domain S-box-containing protein
MDSKKPYTLPRLIVHPQNFSERTHKRGQVTPAYTTVVDNTRMFVDVSESFCDLLGYKRAELLGTRYDHLTAPNTADIPATYNLFSKLGYMHVFGFCFTAPGIGFWCDLKVGCDKIPTSNQT